MFDSNQFFGGERGFYPLNIEQSLRFNDDDSAYLSRTPASAGNRKTWTWSGWVKRGNLTTSAIFGARPSGSNPNFLLRFDSNDRIDAQWHDGTTGNSFTTSAVYRDVSAWYHIVFVSDTTLASNRYKIYVNGEEVTSYVVNNPPPQNTELTINSPSYPHFIGLNNGFGQYPDLYLAEVHFCDGTAYDADAFGEFKSGVWVAKSPSVTYGTNGFYLDFANSADIGNDVSGEGNDWTPNFLTSSDVVLDSPTDNFAVLNNIYIGEYSTHTLYQGNLRWESTSDDFVHKTFAVDSGKWYWEGYYETASGTNLFLGVRPTDATDLTEATYYRTSGGEIYKEGTLNQSSITTLVQTDVVGIAFNADDGEMSWYINGSQIGSTVTGMTISESLAPFVGNGNSSGTKRVIFNFGQDSTFAGTVTAGGNSDANGIGDFKYAPPSGYLALSTANLPEPTISPADDASPSDYFNTVLYTGNSSTNAITGVGFQPDWTWIKRRTGINGHQLYDAIRGAGQVLKSHSTDAEAVETAFNSFDTDGFEVDGGSGSHNLSGEPYVAWNWKANGSGVSNTDGTITSTVSANTTSGFSIVSYTGNDSTGQSFGHGLSEKPDMAIIKNRDGAVLWIVYHKDLTPNTGYLRLNDTTAEQSTANSWDNKTPDSDVIYVGDNSATNGSSQKMIAYCFHSVEGFSKFGSYTGNGSADGPFVYTGFRPAFVMIKRSSSTGSWGMFDDSRSSDNPVNEGLFANLSNAEATATNELDFLSNGFKLRSTGSVSNDSGQTHIFMAFAENPFKYSNAR